MADLNDVISRTLASENLTEALAAVEEYWTADRLLDAQPIGLEAEAPPRALIEMFEADWVAEGAPESRASVLAGGRAVDLGFDELAAEGYETRRVADPSRFPYTAVGKLFMTFDNRNYVGSAWVVGGRAIFTAAHCIFDEEAEDGWADRVLFVPRYHQGQEPLGRWAATSLHTLKGWEAGGDARYQYDMAAATLDRPVGPDTGIIGWVANEPPGRGPFQSIGFPARFLSPTYPFDGKEMWRCNGRYLSGNNPVKMSNNMTQGCSGGPWVVERDGDIVANGLNSFRWSNEPETMNSPYFGQGFLNLLDAAGAR